MVFQIDEEIASRAAKIRAEYTTFKAMDSLQLATACERGCDAFLSNDKRIKKFKDLEVVLVEDLEEELSERWFIYFGKAKAGKGLTIFVQSKKDAKQMKKQLKKAGVPGAKVKVEK